MHYFLLFYFAFISTAFGDCYYADYPAKLNLSTSGSTLGQLLPQFMVCKNGESYKCGAFHWLKKKKVAKCGLIKTVTVQHHLTSSGSHSKYTIDGKKCKKIKTDAIREQAQFKRLCRKKAERTQQQATLNMQNQAVPRRGFH